MSLFHRTLRSALALAVVTSLIVFAPAAGAAPTTWWVDVANGDNANPGTQTSPFRTIDEGLAHAVSGDTVMLMPGTYGPGPEQSFPILLTPGVALEGYKDAEETIISGSGSGEVVRIINPTSHTILADVTVTNPGGSDDTGVHIERTGGTALIGWPLISRCIIEGCGNVSTSGGGMEIKGVPTAAAAPRIEYTTFRNNTADDGGGVYIWPDTKPTFVMCTFDGNTAYRGGGIESYSIGGLTMYGNVFSDNTADGPGGGLYAGGITGPSLHGTEFLGNSAQQGGGICTSGNDPDLDSVTLMGNTAQTGGGAYFENGYPALWNCLIAGNSASGIGSALYVTSNALCNLFNCTVADNTGGTWRGVYADLGCNGELEVYNSIFRGNGSQDIHGASVIDHCNTQDTNLADDANGGSIEGVSHDDPLFVSAPDDYRLSPASPCIDAGGGSQAGAAVEDFFGTLRPQDGDGDGTAVLDIGYHEYVIPTVDRLAGEDRYETAVEIVMSRFTSNKDVIIASGENYPDALSAAGLAGTLECPLLLVRKDSIPPVVAGALVDLNAENLIIVGGTAAVSSAVENAFKADYAVERIWGEDRYATAAAIATEIVELNGDGYTGLAFLARGDAYPDALAVSPLSYSASPWSDGGPILLTKPGDLPDATVAAIKALGVDRGFVAGGEAAVSAAVKTEFDALLLANGGAASVRWWGNDRYETAVAVAEGGAAQGWGSFKAIGIATGTNFPDALVGGVGLGRNNGVLLLTRPDVLSSATADAITDHAPDIQTVEILGGTAAVSAAVATGIEAALGL